MRKVIVSFFIILIAVVLVGENLDLFVEDDLVAQINTDETDEYLMEQRASGSDDFSASLSQMDRDQIDWTYPEDVDYDELDQEEYENYVKKMSGDDNYFLDVHGIRRFDTTEDHINIEEKFFLSHIADVYLNASEYLGKTITYQGMYMEKYDEENDEMKTFVMREGPGCCINDEFVGLEVFMDQPNYQVGQWMEVTGQLVEYTWNDGYVYLALDLENVDTSVPVGARRVFR